MCNRQHIVCVDIWATWPLQCHKNYYYYYYRRATVGRQARECRGRQTGDRRATGGRQAGDRRAIGGQQAGDRRATQAEMPFLATIVQCEHALRIRKNANLFGGCIVHPFDLKSAAQQRVVFKMHNS